MVGVTRFGLLENVVTTIWSARKAVGSSADGSPHGSVITKAPTRGGPEHWSSTVSLP